MSTNKLVLIFLVLIPITFSSTIYRRRRSDDQDDAINNHMDSFGPDVEPYAEEEATNSSDVQTRAERRKGLISPASPPNTDPVQSAVTSDQEKKKVSITTADSSDGNKNPDNLDVMPNPKKGSSHESDPDTSTFGKGASGKQNKLSQHDDDDFLPEMGLLNLGPSDASTPNRDAPLKQPLNIWGTKNVIILLSKLQLNCDKLLA